MEKLEREAYLKLYKLELQRAEEEQKREAEIKRQQDEHAKLFKKLLEASFDGDLPALWEIITEVSRQHRDKEAFIVMFKLLECKDANGNTALSEAAAGGNVNGMNMLLGFGADPNSKGQYGRTPLYRAAFAGHVEAVQLLLQNGADPRLYADDGATPQQIASIEEIVTTLENWDIDTTEKLLQQLDEKRQSMHEKEKKIHASKEERVQDEIDDAEKEYSSHQKQLSKAYEELNKRIYEHDTFGHIKADLTLQAVHDAEEVLENAKQKAENARAKLQKLKLKLRTMRKEFYDISSDDEHDIDVVINIRELDDVLMKDVGNKLQDSGKWPLIIDPGKQAATFLRYRDTNYMNVCNPRHMEPDAIRLSLLGGIRYGKCTVLDLLDIEDIWPAVEQKFTSVQKDLLTEVMSKNILQSDRYRSLLRPNDDEEYAKGPLTQNFKFVILTQLENPPENLMRECYTIKVHYKHE